MARCWWCLWGSRWSWWYHVLSNDILLCHTTLGFSVALGSTGLAGTQLLSVLVYAVGPVGVGATGFSGTSTTFGVGVALVPLDLLVCWFL